MELVKKKVPHTWWCIPWMINVVGNPRSESPIKGTTLNIKQSKPKVMENIKIHHF
jgi:hypothetical protein